VDGLIDRGEKVNPEDELTEAMRLGQENRMLQAKLKDKEVEIALLKNLIITVVGIIYFTYELVCTIIIPNEEP